MNRLTRYRSDIEAYDYVKLTGGISQAVVEKLGQLEDLEDELGCPLDVVVKALKEGVYFNFYRNTYREFIEPSELSLKFSVYYYCIYFEQWGDGYVIDLKDYGKTWWLKGD